MKPVARPLLLRTLAVCMLAAAPLMSMAMTPVAVDRSDSVVQVGKTWLSQAGSGDHGNASGHSFSQDSGAVLGGGYASSFAHAVKGGAPESAPPGDKGGMASDLVWPVDMAADTNSFTPPTQVTPVPEPATYVLMLLGLMAIAFVMRRRAH